MNDRKGKCCGGDKKLAVKDGEEKDFFGKRGLRSFFDGGRRSFFFSVIAL